MTALGVVFELLAVSAFALAALVVALALSLLERRRRLAKQIACGTVGGALGVFAAQGAATVLVVATVFAWKHVAKRTGPEEDAEMVTGLLALGTIAVLTTVGASEGARCGFRVGSGRPDAAALAESWVARTVLRKALW